MTDVTGPLGLKGRSRQGPAADAPRSRIDASRRLCIRSGERPDDFFLLGSVRKIAESFAIHLLRLSFPLTAAKYAEGLIHQSLDQGVPAWSKTAMDKNVDSRDGG